MADSVNQIIDRVRMLHRDLAERVEDVQTAEDQERLRLVLDYIARRERYLDSALASFQNDAPHTVLNAGFKVIPGRPIKECLDLVKLDVKDPDSILRSVLEMDNCLNDILRATAKTAGTPEARELFGQLVEMAEREQRRLVRDTIEMEDL